MSNNITYKAERHRLPPGEAYTYDMLAEDIRIFKELNPDTPIFSIGRSRLCRTIYALKLGCGTRRIFFSGAYHGMEWLTAKTLMRFAEELCRDNLFCNILDGISLYIVPMVNPDGIELAAGGLKWQANAFGVDLNHNFDALWDLSRQIEKNLGIYAPSPTRYGGEFPESEPESRAIADFTRQNRFDLIAALHSQGEVIYYDFCGLVPDGTHELLSRIEAASGYRRDRPEGVAAYGGYKDWFIRKFKKIGLTIEIGNGENPLPMSVFDKVYAGVQPVLREILEFKQ